MRYFSTLFNKKIIKKRDSAINKDLEIGILKRHKIVYTLHK